MSYHAAASLAIALGGQEILVILLILLILVGPVVLCLGLIWFFVIRPNRRRSSMHEASDRSASENNSGLE